MDLTWFVSLLLAFIISSFIYSTWNSIYRGRNLPPGPTPLPIFGNVLHVKRGEIVKSLMEFGKKYGSIYTVYFGHYPVVVLCGYDTVKEALIDRAEEFGGRGRLPTIDQFVKGYEQYVDPTSLLVQAVSNVICSIVFGNRFEYSNDSFQKLLRMFAIVFQDMSSIYGQFQDMLPTLMSYIPGPHQRINESLGRLTDFILERIKMNEESFDPNSPRDYIDCFLTKQKQEMDNPNFDRNNMVMTILNLFFAGTETVSSTIRFGFMTLMKHPEIQAKVHQEIDHAIGDSRIPNIEDRSKMPYMDAVIHEIQRFCDILPVNVPHATTKDVTFKGYTIPKGTDVYPLLCSVLRDPTKLASPDKFDPNNFLDNKGCFKKNDTYMPFSAGKRICLGEGLARMELFIFFTTILQQFKLIPEKTLTEQDIRPRMAGFANIPKFYRMKFIPRI
ncbi:cytochrome P450 2G1-like isoform X2 [Phyllobates terribilis]|uniref:cytochrome P450 2G1-like isoform X2 n=1 Tax=Phyllobates terribilis TaxID=111132 RepID=UPI003CCAD03A